MKAVTGFILLLPDAYGCQASAFTRCYSNGAAVYGPTDKGELYVGVKLKRIRYEQVSDEPREGRDTSYITTG